MDLNWKNPKMIHVPAQRKARYLFFISSDEFTHLKYFHI